MNLKVDMRRISEFIRKQKNFTGIQSTITIMASNPPRNIESRHENVA